ncbi:MAG: hypothetical protein ACXVDD_07535, partial [Polyangia bacterium]
MPTFVPRTVASFERTATAVARRVAAPVRMLATRALSFADRLVGSWTGGTPTVGGFESGARPAMLASTRGAGMPLPRPWYEVDHDEDTIWPQQAAMAAAQRASATTAAATLPSAERGAAIARTTLTAPDAPSARAVTPSAQPPVEATTVTAREAQQIAAAATADVRVAEALGLRAPIAAPAPSVAPVVARATTPLGRALAHAAWVDTQLRVTAPAARAATTATPGYVFIAPADVERPMAPGAAAAIGTESLSQPSSQPARPAAAQALAAPSV